MLKIRDDVDLKELEKFGFKQDLYTTPLGSIMFCFKGICYDCIEQKAQYIFISKKSSGYCYGLFSQNNKLNFCDNIEIYNEESLFKDLIQAGLVEKVEE